MSDDDVSFALAAKSDQLNAMDIMGFDSVITIRDVSVKKTTEQPVWIYFNGDNNRPWKPSKGMLRILSAAWGARAKQWIGKSVQIFCNEEVRYGGKPVGGIQIKALSHIAHDMSFMHSESRGKRVPYPVKKLEVAIQQYPDAEFEQRLPTMIECMTSGKMTLQQVIAHCQKTGALTEAQLKQLEQAAPVELDNENEDEVTE